MSAEPSGNASGGSPEAEAAAATARRIVTICNQKGLHARAAARFVKTAHEFDADIWVRKNGSIVSGRSIMGLMMLAAAAGAELQISAAGPDADAAVETLARLVECKFDED
ncbi:MAG: HPr family phosphocarrier protein [Alphaproteobacteria bacterium]|nr:HPr family phosphocarrier protein [Alphaproteobacteria bacterium]MBV9554578.1 HPr family phosphocarrier protein [Alphaproteobacteria bacterium]